MNTVLTVFMLILVGLFFVWSASFLVNGDACLCGGGAYSGGLNLQECCSK